MQQYKKALADFSKAIELSLNRIKSYDNNYNKFHQYLESMYNNRGNVYFKLGNLKKALSDFIQAAKLKPDCAETLYIVGLLYRKQGKLQKALSYFEKASQLGYFEAAHFIYKIKATLSKKQSVNEKIGRNDPCPCGSGLKYKKCCFIKEM